MTPQNREQGCGSGSSIFSNCGFGSGSSSGYRVDDQKLKKFFIVLNKHCNLLIPRPPGKNAQATGEAFRSQKRTSSNSKHEISSLFVF
jgi:hypothetical protein